MKKNRKQNLNQKQNRGFTLIELMVATTLATLMSFGVLSIYVNQAGTLSAETQRDSTTQEAQRAFDIISRLLRQAQQSSIVVTNTTFNNNETPEAANDAVDVVFTLPENQSIWPNTNAGPNNAVRLSWHNSSAANPYQIRVSNAASIGTLPTGGNMNVFAGGNLDSLPRVVNMDLWPLLDQRTRQNAAGDAANSGYLLRITTRAAEPDISYINPDVPDGTFKNYRTYTVSGIVSPRNP